MNISILNLPKNLTEDELQQLFSPYGAIVSCTLIMDPATEHSKGFGFVEMEQDAEAEAAITALHGTKIGQKKLRVKASNPTD